jgi:phytoene synthase
MTDRALPLTSETDRAAVQAVVEQAGSSFYWAMRLLPARKRAGLFALYAFCRVVDDIADGDAPSSEKRAQLAAWHQTLDQLNSAPATTPLERALASTVRDFPVDRADLHAIIDGMEMDAAGPIVAPDRATLDLYCDRVAGAVGRAAMAIFGGTRAEALSVANPLGRALQFTNILRDVHEDAALGRLYLPAEDLAAAGITSRDPLVVAADPRLPAVCKLIGWRAGTAFAEAEAAIARCDRKVVRPAVIMKDVYRPTLDRIAASGWQPPRDPPTAWQTLARRAAKLWIALSRSLV